MEGEQQSLGIDPAGVPDRAPGVESTPGYEPAPSSDQAPSFEQAFHQLEETVRLLEDPELPLEEAVRIYEEGVRLAALCDSMLETAELKVARLSAKGTEVPLP